MVSNEGKGLPRQSTPHTHSLHSPNEHKESSLTTHTHCTTFCIVFSTLQRVSLFYSNYTYIIYNKMMKMSRVTLQTFRSSGWSHSGFHHSILTATNNKLFSLGVDDDQLHFLLLPPDRTTSSMGCLASMMALLHTHVRGGVTTYAA
jgi:hypothetical protein